MDLLKFGHALPFAPNSQRIRTEFTTVQQGKTSLLSSSREFCHPFWGSQLLPVFRWQMIGAKGGEVWQTLSQVCQLSAVSSTSRAFFAGYDDRHRHSGTVIMSLIESAKIDGQDPWARLTDVFGPLPNVERHDIEQLLPHNWRATTLLAAVDIAPVAKAAQCPSGGCRGRRNMDGAT